MEVTSKRLSGTKLLKKSLHYFQLLIQAPSKVPLNNSKSSTHIPSHILHLTRVETENETLQFNKEQAYILEMFADHQQLAQPEKKSHPKATLFILQVFPECLPVASLPPKTQRQEDTT